MFIILHTYVEIVNVKKARFKKLLIVLGSIPKVLLAALRPHEVDGLVPEQQ